MKNKIKRKWHELLVRHQHLLLWITVVLGIVSLIKLVMFSNWQVGIVYAGLMLTFVWLVVSATKEISNNNLVIGLIWIWSLLCWLPVPINMDLIQWFNNETGIELMLGVGLISFVLYMIINDYHDLKRKKH